MRNTIHLLSAAMTAILALLLPLQLGTMLLWAVQSPVPHTTVARMKKAAEAAFSWV